MSGSVNALSYRLGSSMSWGYSTSPIFLSFSIKNSMLLSKLLPAVMRRFGLHVVEFYSFFETSFLLFVFISKLLALRHRIRRRFGRRRSRRKKAFHRITYSLNKNFVNWRILSFVRNSFRSYNRISKMLSFQFYAKAVRVRLSYKNLIKRVKIGRKVLRYFKRRLFLVNLRAKSSTRQLKSAFFIRYSGSKRCFLPNLKKFRLYCSPMLLSRCFLKKKHLSKKRYALKHKLLYAKRLNRKNFTTRRRRFYTNFRKRRAHFSYKFGGRHGRGGRYKKSLLSNYPVYYSLRGLFTRAKLIRRIFNIVFIKVLLQKFFFKQSFFSKLLRQRRLLHIKKLFASKPSKFFFNQGKLLLRAKNYKKRTFAIKPYNNSVLLKYFLFRKKINFKSRILCTEKLVHYVFKRLVSAVYSYSNQRPLFTVSLLASKKKKNFFLLLQRDYACFF